MIGMNINRKNSFALSQFRIKLKEMMTAHPSEIIKFGDFLNYLIANDIRLYSKNQLNKISKFFDNQQKTTKIVTPLSYLTLHCTQQGSRKIHIVKVSQKIVNYLGGDPTTTPHNIHKCLQCLVFILRKQYGSDKNWFKVLGGFTIAMNIEKNVFKSHLVKILRNTSHYLCVDNIVHYFTEQQGSKQVEWSVIMKILTVKPQPRHSRCRTADVHRITAQSPKKIDFNETLFTQNTFHKPAILTSHSPARKFVLGIHLNRKQKNQFSIESKSCQIDKRKSTKSMSKNRRQTQPICTTTL